MPAEISADTLRALQHIDTCSVANAIEMFDVRLRNEGFAGDGLQARFPNLPPMVGYATTLRVRASSPPMEGGAYLDRTDWWKGIGSFSVPHVLVIEDIDAHPGRGAFVDHVHAAILRAMGCAGVVTNGAVRDLPAVEAMGFSLFSQFLSVSHAYMHVVEFGVPVEIAGLRIAPGDLLHGDLHGVIRIPPRIAAEIPSAVRLLRRREKSVIEFCDSSEFSVPALERLLEETQRESAGEPPR